MHEFCVGTRFAAPTSNLVSIFFCCSIWTVLPSVHHVRYNPPTHHLCIMYVTTLLHTFRASCTLQLYYTPSVYHVRYNPPPTHLPCIMFVTTLLHTFRASYSLQPSYTPSVHHVRYNPPTPRRLHKYSVGYCPIAIPLYILWADVLSHLRYTV